MSGSRAARVATGRWTPAARSSRHGARAAAGSSRRSCTMSSRPADASPTDPGSAYALDQIAAGRVAGLVLARLGDLTRSVTELARLLQWLDQAGAFMIALDYELDTSTTAGELAAGALMEIGDWERGRIADRTRPGLTAIRRQGAASNRASVRDDPELAARIQSDASPGHVTAGHQRHPQRRRRPDAARWDPLAAFERPGRDRLQAPAGQAGRRPRAPAGGARQRPARSGRWDNGA